MDHRLLQNAGFWAFLLSADKQLAATACQAGCPCGGHLHRANYPRKPRCRLADLPPEYRYRLSFCCDREGCRKRGTPPSVRFLGRKVYLHAVVILVAAMRQGPSPRRVHELSQLFGADRRTIARWQVFWREHLPQTLFGKVARISGTGDRGRRASAGVTAGVSPQRRTGALRGLEAAAPFSLADHDHRGPEYRGFSLTFRRPQRRGADDPGGPD